MIGQLTVDRLEIDNNLRKPRRSKINRSELAGFNRFHGCVHLPALGASQARNSRCEPGTRRHHSFTDCTT